MATGDRSDPYRGYNFLVEITGAAIAGFSEASGLTFEADPVEYREGTDLGLHVRKLTGLRKFSNIVLKRGITRSTQLWDWYKNVLNGVEDRRDVAIVLRDEQHQPVLRWETEGAWICKWEGPTFSATSNDVSLESVELCVERVELV